MALPIAEILQLNPRRGRPAGTNTHDLGHVPSPCLSLPLCTEGHAKMPSKALWSHYLVLGRGTGKGKGKSRWETPSHFHVVRGQAMRPKSNPGSPSKPGSFGMDSGDTAVGQLRSLGKGRALPGHMPSGSSHDICFQQKFRFSSVACIFAVHLLHAWPWAEPSCS